MYQKLKPVFRVIGILLICAIVGFLVGGVRSALTGCLVGAGMLFYLRPKPSAPPPEA
jgi:hypothetical protein